MRYFHQPKEHWLERGTLQDWVNIYNRELIESPPADEFVALYFIAHKWWTPPDKVTPAGVEDDGGAEPDLWETDLPDFTD